METQGKRCGLFPAYIIYEGEILVMEMPERVIENSNKTLTVYIDSQPFELGEKQYLKSDKGKILLKHRSIVELAELTGIEVGPPVLVHTHGPSIYIFARSATRNGKSVTEIGESNSQSLYDEVMKITPATTADNRAYERAVLKLLGIYGDVYGASEIDFRDGKKPPSSVSQNEPKKATAENDTPPADEKKGSGEPAHGINAPSGQQPPWWDDTGLGAFKESELNPDTFIITQGPLAGKNWTAKQLYDYQYNSCKYFADRTALDTANDEFKKQVYACRRAIRKYGIK